MPIICLSKPNELCNGNIEHDIHREAFKIMVHILNKKTVVILHDQAQPFDWLMYKSIFTNHMRDLCGCDLYMITRSKVRIQYRVLYNTSEFPDFL